MNIRVMCFLTFVSSSTELYAGGILGDMLNVVTPGAGTSLDNTHRNMKTTTPISKAIEEEHPEALQNYRSVEEQGAPPEEVKPYFGNNASRKRFSYSYICMTPYGSCSLGEYGIAGASCYCSTPNGAFFGIMQ